MRVSDDSMNLNVSSHLEALHQLDQSVILILARLLASTIARLQAARMENFATGVMCVVGAGTRTGLRQQVPRALLELKFRQRRLPQVQPKRWERRRWWTAARSAISTKKRRSSRSKNFALNSDKFTWLSLAERCKPSLP